MIQDFDYTLRAAGRTLGRKKIATVQEEIRYQLADGSFEVVTRTTQIEVTQPFDS